jgi:hypothetical protein
MVNVKHINDERLGRWKVQMIRRHSTPLILIGIGHDHNIGEVTVLCTEDRTDEQLLLFMENAVKQLREQIAEKN